VSVGGAGTQGRSGSAAPFPPPEFLEPAPQLSEARRSGEKTPRELAAPTAPRTWCNAEPRKTTPGRETTGIPGSREIAHPEARVESVGETREATGSCGRAGPLARNARPKHEVEAEGPEV